MILHAPIWLSLLALGLVIVALHLRRHRQVVVSSVHVWQRVAGRQGRNRKRARPRLDTPLILQLLALALLALALSGPRSAHSLSAGDIDHLVIVLDASGSMGTEDEGLSRLDEAKSWLTRAVKDLPAQVRYSLVVANSQPSVPAARQRDPAGVDDVVSRIEGSIPSVDWHRTTQLTRGLMVPGERTHLVIVSDLDRTPSEFAALAERSADIEISLRTVAGEVYNAGIARATAVWHGNLIAVDATAVVANADRASIDVGLYYRQEPDDEPLLWDSVEIEVGSSQDIQFQVETELPEAGGLLELRLPEDALGWDNSAWFRVLPEEVQARVLIVGPLEPSLQRAFQALPAIELYSANTLPSDSEQFDLVVVNGIQVDRHPGTHTWWLGVLPVVQSPQGTRSMQRLAVKDQEPVEWEERHPLSLGVDWSSLRSRVALPVDLSGRELVLVESLHGPLVYAHWLDSGLELVTAFPLSDSNWTSLPAFPSFIANLVEFVQPNAGARIAEACHVDSTCYLPVAGARLVDHYGQEVAPQGALGGVPAFVPAWPGVYQAELGERLLPVTVNAFFPEELPRSSSGVAPGPARQGSPASEIAVTEFWRWLALTALLVLTLDILWSGFARERFLSKRSLVGPHPSLSRNRLLVALQVTTILALLLGLLEVPLPVSDRQQTTVLLVPDTVVASAQGQEAITGLLAEARNARVDPALVTIGAPSQVVSDLGERLPGAVSWDESEEAAVSGVPATGGSDLAAALELAKGLLAGAEQGRIVLAWDGIDTSEYGEWELQLLTSTGITVDVLPLAAASDDEVLVEEVRLPRQVSEGETFRLQAVVAARSGGTAVATLFRDGEAIEERLVELPPGRDLLEWSLDEEEAGTYRYEVSVAAVGDDRSENNMFGSVIRVTSPPTATLVTPDTVWGELFARLLEAQGWITEVRVPRNAFWSIEELLGSDVVALLNVPAIDLHSSQQALLESWVSQHGGGLAILGGENSFGPGGYFQTPIETISPLSSRLLQETPAVALVFVLDRSGSMIQAVGELTRLDVAQEAAKAAIELLHEESEVGVVAFDSVANVISPLTPLIRVEELKSAIDSLRASGGTAIYPGLELAFEQMTQSTASVRHVVVMTDGLSQPGPFEDLTSNFRAAGVTISGVSIGTGANRAIVEDIARWGNGTFHSTSDFAALPSILAQEALLLGSSPIRSGQSVPVWGDRDFSFLNGLPDTLPPITGYVATTAKPEANVHMLIPASDDRSEEPLLASWRYGLGQVLAFTSHGAGRWTEEWLARDDYSLLWSQSFRSLLPQAVGPGLHVRSELHGELVHLEVEAIDDNGQPSRGDEVGVAVSRAVDQGVLPTLVRLNEIAPGIYRGEVSLSSTGVHRLVAGVLGADEMFTPAGNEEAVTWIDHSYPSRYRYTLASEVLATAVANVTGGRALDVQGAAGMFETSRGWQFRDGRVPWLLMALALFMASLMVRYGAFKRLSRTRPRSPASTFTTKQT